MHYLIRNTHAPICIYCGCILTSKNMTIDHSYPQIYGGPTIPENMALTCSSCNNRKGFLNHSEYLHRKNLNPKAFDRSKKKVRVHHSEKQKEQGFLLPDDWFEFIETSEIVPIDFSKMNFNKKLKKINNFYSKNRKLPFVVVLDKNNNVLEGFSQYYFSVSNNLKYIPIIKIDNIALKDFNV